MRIALMVEGETEKVFLPYLRGFLEPRLPGKMPRIEVFRYDGRIPKEGQEIFRLGTKGRHYVKTRDAARILRDQDLTVAIQACPELKAMVNTILEQCGGEMIP